MLPSGPLLATPNSSVPPPQHAAAVLRGGSDPGVQHNPLEQQQHQQAAQPQHLTITSDPSRTVAIWGFPPDMKPRELPGLLWGLPGCLNSQLTLHNGAWLGIALFSTVTCAATVVQQLHGLEFDAGVMLGADLAQSLLVGQVRPQPVHNQSSSNAGSSGHLDGSQPGMVAWPAAASAGAQQTAPGVQWTLAATSAGGPAAAGGAGMGARMLPAAAAAGVMLSALPGQAQVEPQPQAVTVLYHPPAPPAAATAASAAAYGGMPVAPTQMVTLVPVAGSSGSSNGQVTGSQPVQQQQQQQLLPVDELSAMMPGLALSSQQAAPGPPMSLSGGGSSTVQQQQQVLMTSQDGQSVWLWPSSQAPCPPASAAEPACPLMLSVPAGSAMQGSGTPAYFNAPGATGVLDPPGLINSNMVVPANAVQHPNAALLGGGLVVNAAAVGAPGSTSADSGNQQGSGYVWSAVLGSLQ